MSDTVVIVEATHGSVLVGAQAVAPAFIQSGGPRGQKGDKGDKGDEGGMTQLGGLPIEFNNVEEGDLIMYISGTWKNDHKNNISDGGNF